MSDTEFALRYLRSQATTKNWPRLGECADVLDRAVRRHDGWVSPLRAKRAASRVSAMAAILRGALADDEGAEEWARELDDVAKYLAPKAHE